MDRFLHGSQMRVNGTLVFNNPTQCPFEQWLSTVCQIFCKNNACTSVCGSFSATFWIVPHSRYDYISLLLIVTGIFLRLMKWPLGGVLLSSGSLWYCFAFAPLELKHKYLKWLPYSKNRQEVILLSLIDFRYVLLELQV